MHVPFVKFFYLFHSLGSPFFDWVLDLYQREFQIESSFEYQSSAIKHTKSFLIVVKSVTKEVYKT